MFLVAQALVVSPPATADEIDELLGTNDPVATLDALGRLAALGLVLVEDRVATPLPALVDLLDRPLGLGPSYIEHADLLADDVLADLAATLGAEGAPTQGATVRAIARRLRTAEGVERLVAGAPPGTAELLETLAGERSSAVDVPIGLRYRSLDDAEPVSWLLRRGLLVPYDEFLAEPVRELTLSRHPHGLAPGAALRPIEVLAVDGLAPAAVAAAAADRASRTLEAAETLLRLVADGEVAVRKSGGVGVREVRRLAKILELEPVELGRLLELLEEARLIRQVDQRLIPSPRADTWGRLSRDRRWLVLARAWIAADRFLSVALSTGPDGKQVPALGRIEPVADAFGARQMVLERAASLAEAKAYDPDQFAEAVVWHSPNLWGPGDPPTETLVDWIVAEAELLGFIAMSAPSSLLRALVGDDDGALETLAASTLGSDQDRFMLQGDLTAMALGPLDPAVAAPLGELADRRPDAATPLYRFTESSIRRAFDRGWTAATIIEFLERHALSGIPQPLSYLVADVDRRYGSIRVMAASSVLVTDDEALAVEVATTRRATRLGLRLVAPTVLVGPVAPHQLLDELRAEGLFPVLDGDVARLSVEGAVAGGDARPGAGDIDDLPADWTGPVLSAAALAGEVADVVAALADEPDAEAEDDTGSSPHRLHLLWNRPAVVTHLCDGQLREARGVVVAVDEALTLLNDTGIERVGLETVVAVDDPSR